MLHASASAPHMGSLSFSAGVNGSPSALMGYQAGPAPSGAMWGQASFQGQHQQQQGFPQQQQQQSYPAQQQGYAAQQQGYPAQHQGYAAQQQGYPAQQQGFPSQQQSPAQAALFAGGNVGGAAGGMFGVQHNPFFAQRQAQMQQQQQQQQQMYLQQVS